MKSTCAMKVACDQNIHSAGNLLGTPVHLIHVIIQSATHVAVAQLLCKNKQTNMHIQVRSSHQTSD